MGNHKPLLSLCIPTNGIVEWVLPTIDSIYSQGVDNSLFEVIVTDNGDESYLKEAVKQYDYDNFHYYRTKSQGFTNQIDAFKKGTGRFCKMLNHRSRMLPGSINNLIELVKKYQDTKPIIYCAEGYAQGDEIIECANTDEFVQSLSYFVSWSVGTGVWWEDMWDLRNKNIDTFFPHIVFILGLRKDSRYVIWNGKYETMASDEGKGGYDLFNCFGVRLLDILSDLRYEHRISEKTFTKVKKELFRFLMTLYQNEVILPTKHTYIIKDIRQSIQVYYGYHNYLKLVVGSYILYIIITIKRLFRSMNCKMNIISKLSILTSCENE